MRDKPLPMLKYIPAQIRIMAEITMSLFGKEVVMRQPLPHRILHAAEGEKMLNFLRALATKDNNLQPHHRVDQKQQCRTIDHL